MGKLVMCRICLAEDVRMYLIGKTHLKTMYEILATKPFQTNDRRPIVACYICCARLQNCYQLRMSCLESEESFTQMLQYNMPKPVKLQLDGNVYKLEIVHPMINLSVDQVFETNTGSDIQKDVPNMTHKIKTECEEDMATHSTSDFHERSLPSHIQDHMYAQIIKTEDDEMIYPGADIPEDPLALTPGSSQVAKVEAPEDLTVLINNLFPESETKPTPAIDDSKETCIHINPNSCHKCSYKRINLSNHVRSQTSEQSYQCDTCEKCFTRKSHLIRHIRTHTDKKLYQCFICERCFKQSNHLSNHMRIHTGEKLNQCKIRSQCFPQRDPLDAHIRTHTRVKAFQCSECEIWFPTKNYLISHIRIHTPEKLYQCKRCNQRFIGIDSLNIHMRLHTTEKSIRTYTGDKPYICYFCNKGFKSKCYLSYHMNIHTGGKPYQCNICNLSFNRRGNLHSHIVTHTDEIGPLCY